jgi:hypothetical protein
LPIPACIELPQGKKLDVEKIHKLSALP